MFRNLPHSGPRSLHRHLCPYLLDWWHYRHLLAPSYAQFRRPCRCFWYLCSRVLCSLGICLFESSRNQGHAPRSHHRVLLSRSQAGWCCQDQLIWAFTWLIFFTVPFSITTVLFESFPFFFFNILILWFCFFYLMWVEIEKRTVSVENREHSFFWFIYHNCYTCCLFCSWVLLKLSALSCKEDARELGNFLILQRLSQEPLGPPHIWLGKNYYYCYFRLQLKFNLKLFLFNLRIDKWNIVISVFEFSHQCIRTINLLLIFFFFPPKFIFLFLFWVCSFT